MNHLPEFITFTGLDRPSDVAAMIELSMRYPLEVGVLLASDRAGSARYPRREDLLSILDATAGRLRLSAHLCGAYVQELLATGRVADIECLMGHFHRTQINVRAPVDVDRVARWAHRYALAPILQCRGDFPNDERVSWLFDQSGGRGVAPSHWPAPASEQAWCGYAGGIGPDNAAQVLATLSPQARRYWIDMETGVCGAGGLDPTRCAAVCKAVYG